MDQKTKDLFIQKINSKKKINCKKRSFALEIFQSINTISSKILNSVMNSTIEEDIFLNQLKSSLLEFELISTTHKEKLEKIDILPFEPHLTQENFKINLENLINSIYTSPNEKVNESLLNSLIFRIPQYSDDAKKIAKSKFKISNKEWEKKYFFDEQNSSLSIFKGDKKVYVYNEGTRKNFALESKIECFDFSEKNNTLAIGCQNGQAYIIDRSRESGSRISNPSKLEFVNLNNSSAALTKMKYSASGRILCFSNFNNQVYVYRDNTYLSDNKVELNSLKISVVSYICATDAFCFIGTKEGGVYVYSVESNTWSSIRPFVNTIDCLKVSLDEKILIVMSDKDIKAFKLEHENKKLGSVPIWEKSMKNVFLLTLFEENFEYFALVDKKIVLIFNIQTGISVQETKGLFRFMVLTSQYKNLMKYWYLME